MQITAQQLTRISKAKPNPANVNAVVTALNSFGPKFGLDQPHRIAQFLAQVMHESGGLIHMKEILGSSPTPAQARYERDFTKPWKATDKRNRVAFRLGNTEKGDGSKYRGYGPIQLTGRGNVTRFYKWCVAHGFDVPNFIDHPELIAQAPWSGLSAIWFWSVGNSTGKSLNVYADRGGDIENITKIVNGGLNGYEDRLSYFDRASLILLGYGVRDVAKFQKDEKLTPDGVSGPLTRAAFQKELLKLTSSDDKAALTTISPVMSKGITKTVEVDKPVVPQKVENQVKKKSNFLGQMTGVGTAVGAGFTALLGADWQAILAVGGVGVVAVLLIFLLRHQIVAAVREIKGQVETA